VREGLASVTAARVAAYRRGFDRQPAAFGDPVSEERLAADVAADLDGFEPSPQMSRYLAARTSFFDRVTLRALDRGVTQVLLVGAGYDGRALRYSRPGVRWFEVDHPTTQADKRARLERLGVETGGIAFVPRDLRKEGLATNLVAAGLEADAPLLILCEGVAVYLDPPVLEGLLAELRSLASPGTRLAISTSAERNGGDEARDRFMAGVAAVGEPARSILTSDSVSNLLAESRWRRVDTSEQAQRVGFVVAAPEWLSAATQAPPSISRIGAYLDRTFHRDGTERLADHLRTTYGVDTTRMDRLDVGVFRVDLTDGARWVVRVHPASRPLDVARLEARVLSFLADADFPAERCAAPDPVSTHEGQAVIVTGHLAGTSPPATHDTFRSLGELLGRLHTLSAPPDVAVHPGGAWHHLAVGGPDQEISGALGLLDDARPRVRPAEVGHFETVREALARSDACAGLPEALIHPDFVPANALATSADRIVILDWTGAGWGARLWSLAFLLWAAGRRDSLFLSDVLNGYGRHVQLEPEELERLPGVMAARPMVLDAWAFATGRERLVDVAERVEDIRRESAAIAARARASATALRQEGPRPE